MAEGDENQNVSGIFEAARNKVDSGEGKTPTTVIEGRALGQEVADKIEVQKANLTNETFKLIPGRPGDVEFAKTINKAKELTGELPKKGTI